MAVSRAGDLGTSCLVTALESYSNILSNDPRLVDEAIIKLQLLEDAGTILVELSVEEKKEFEKKEIFYQNQLEEHQRKKAEHETIRIQLEGEKSGLKASAAQHEKSLSRAKDDERRAENELDEAKEKLERAEKEEESKRKKGAIGGAIAGFMVGGPLGAIYGGVVGSVVSHIIVEAQGHVDKAEERIKERQSEVYDAQDNVDSVKRSIRKTQRKIDACNRNINECNRLVDRIHDHIGALKDSKAFAMEAISLWEHFTLACQDATERTERLKKVVVMAEKTREYRLLKSDGTITKVNSFMKGWEAITTRHEDLQQAIDDD